MSSTSWALMQMVALHKWTVLLLAIVCARADDMKACAPGAQYDASLAGSKMRIPVPKTWEAWQH
eukprot:1947336-Amphidinium_carterae.1